jgi:hypothetical protein
LQNVAVRKADSVMAGAEGRKIASMPFSQPTNWVARRAEAERALVKAAPDSWNMVRAEIQDACNTFQHEYRGGAVRVDCKLENGNRILVTVLNGQERSDVVIAFNQAAAAIDVSGPSGHQRYFFRWHADGGATFIESSSGEQVNDLSRRILEPILFP